MKDLDLQRVWKELFLMKKHVSIYMQKVISLFLWIIQIMNKLKLALI